MHIYMKNDIMTYKKVVLFQGHGNVHVALQCMLLLFIKLAFLLFMFSDTFDINLILQC